MREPAIPILEVRIRAQWAATLGYSRLPREMDMALTNLQEKRGQLSDALRGLAAVAADAIVHATMLLRYNDEATALILAKSNELIQLKLLETRDFTLALHAVQRPLGSDLRLLQAIPDVCRELDRIGWYAHAIAQLAARRDGHETPALFTDLQLMASQAAIMIEGAVRAFTDQELQTAQFLAIQVGAFDTAFNQIYCEGLDLIAAEPASEDHVRLIITAAHDLRCIAGRVARVCERTFFAVTGDWPQTNYVKVDEPLLTVE